MTKLIIFNWKMGPPSLGEAKRLLTYNLQLTTNNKNVEIVVCPPFIYLQNLKLKTSANGGSASGGKNFKLGAQDVFWENSGAYTGEISPRMLKNSGVEYVIIGHSERRQILGETDEMINKKVKAALAAGLKAVLCVGEPRRSIKYQVSSIKAAKNFVNGQLKKDLRGIENCKLKIENLIIAYEPIWAIGTGRNASPEYALQMIKYIKSFLSIKYQVSSIKVLYGGSVTGKNIGNYLKYKEIDGALVGGASLKKEEIRKIIEIANEFASF